MKHLWIILIVWNIVTFIMMGIDKFQAKNNGWRISERTLILSAFLMGGIGSIIGSKMFHHKTAKTKFRILLPLSIIINCVVIYLVMV